MVHYTKKNPPPNQWELLVELSLHQPGTIEWWESNIGNVLRSVIHNCGYWQTIDSIFPEPCQNNDWLYNPDIKSYVGYFITRYEELYGYWSHNYAYRSHYFYISTEPKGEIYYTAGDPPQFLIDNFEKRGVEVVPWDKSLNEDHPLLQKAKAECQTFNPPLNKALATRIWNSSTLDTFMTEWEARKVKHLKQQVKKLFGDEALKYVINKNRVERIIKKAVRMKTFFAVYQLACLSYDVIESNKEIQISSQILAFVDDLIIDFRDSKLLQHYQLKNSPNVKWGSMLKSISDDFKKQYSLNKDSFRDSKITLIVSDEELRLKLDNTLPEEIRAFSQVLYFPYQYTLTQVIQQYAAFYQAIEYISAFEKPDLDKVECVATVLLGAWVSSEKLNVPVINILRKAQEIIPSYIRSFRFREDLKLETEVEEILSVIKDFTYKLTKGFLHWQFQNGLVEGTFQYSIDTERFSRFEKLIKKYRPTTFEDLEEFFDMTRIYSALSNFKIKDLLNVLINQSSSPETYKETIFTLGLNLGDIILTQINNAQDEVCLACTVEDADFLAKGILARLESRLTRVALVCFWNQYFSPFDIEDLEVAPIIKRYQEPLVENIKYLVIAQSIISETCVIRTNLMNLIQKTKPEKILIAAPVVFSQSEKTLKDSFEKEIHDKFQFFYFAVDDQCTEEGEVIPGVGGIVYNRLGFSGQDAKNKYIPEIVKARRTNFVNV